MTGMKAQALRVAVLKALADQVAAAAAEQRNDLQRRMVETGAERVTAELPDGTKVASVSIAGGHKVTAVVVDEAELTAWVREHHPEHLEERIRPAYRKALLEELGRNGEEVPGVELTLSTAYLSNRFIAGGKDAIARAWAAGALDLPRILELPAGGDSS
ncbi:hypothetical protein [Actinomadura sp. SCN-SB]|uniref:hypothetical protein n=1 Tax=Actinomadura sp. SCN-SB TaxID=3373092 RepID=UPI003753B311